MRNERLLDALARCGRTPGAVADEIGVDPKTVERWITQSRVPYARHRHLISTMVGESESWLWPGAYTDERRDKASRSEVVEVFAHRSQVPSDTWQRLVDGACSTIDVLVYAGLFLPEQNPDLMKRLEKRAADGVAIRLLFGDPDCDAVAVRGAEEGIGDAVGIKIRNALHFYRTLLGVPGVEVRLHATTLYTSIYRSDDEMIVNQHVIGLPAAQSPAMLLRRLVAGELFDTYAAAFERVWECATPAR